MSDEEAETAAVRIDRALARIEAAARVAAADGADLRRRHDELRAQVTVAIAALDSLIAEEGDAD